MNKEKIINSKPEKSNNPIDTVGNFKIQKISPNKLTTGIPGATNIQNLFFKDKESAVSVGLESCFSSQ
jgi:hypothetical protein